ncbi:MAG: hypothetical protein JNJ50_28180 [Acidobacteria bacterium]|nr:hypothetical protein [Acidobacteriota bacterium]
MKPFFLPAVSTLRAYSTAQRAVEIYTRLGVSSDIEDARATLAECET